ncbi:MAG: hypothetical protein H6607_07795 [Flavobacteriales bacterium]|nr:hypothetical protein [Flavobacteriales bacterium]
MRKFIENIKRKFLLKQSKTVFAVREFTPVKKATTLAVLYLAEHEQCEAILKKLKIFCEENHLKLISFGYFDDKQLNTHLIPTSSADFFCNKHLDSFKLPHKSEFIRFTDKKFDFLLNIYPPTCLPLLGLSSLSEAKFRVGSYLPQYSFCFDLMLKSNHDDLLVFTDEILNYIKNFGNGKI